ncbi:hypothetical protein [uncultured Methylobacterium sp.]|uniref:hypothetical protein n=1 Tax=uncultured Methylobacterium sp. TaxID=157278 RepID=UPI0035CA69E4
MTDTEIEAITQDVLRAKLGKAGFEDAEVTTGLDHDGDASLFVTVRFKAKSGVTDGAASSEAHAALRRRLLDLGEDRFPYLRYRYPDDEVLIGQEEPEDA